MCVCACACYLSTGLLRRLSADGVEGGQIQAVHRQLVQVVQQGGRHVGALPRARGPGQHQAGSVCCGPLQGGAEEGSMVNKSHNVIQTRRLGRPSAQVVKTHLMLITSVSANEQNSGAIRSVQKHFQGPRKESDQRTINTDLFHF